MAVSTPPRRLDGEQISRIDRDTIHKGQGLVLRQLFSMGLISSRSRYFRSIEIRAAQGTGMAPPQP